MKTKFLLIAWSLFSVLGFGCSPKAVDAPFCETSVTESNISGTWQLTPDSSNILKNYTGKPHANISFVLNTNGQLLANDLPIDIGQHTSKLEFVTDVGTWEVQPQSAVFRVSLTLRSHGQYLDARIYGGEIILTMTLEDPDSGKVLVYMRNKEAH